MESSKLKAGKLPVATVGALRREIREETNLKVTDIRFVLAQDCIHSTEFYRDAHFVLLNYTALASGEQVVRLNDEAEEFEWVTVKQALGMKINEPTRILLKAVQKTHPESGR